MSKTLRLSGILVAAVVGAANLFGWATLNRPQDEMPWIGKIKGMSFSPYQQGQNPFKGIYPTPDDIARDLDALKDYTGKIRTYSVTNGLQEIPKLAAPRKVNVTLGAWLDRRKEANEQEIENLIQLANKHRNVDRLIVGNETLLRGDLSPSELTQYLRRVKRHTKQPISTAEPWGVWLQFPELAKEVDFIAVHLLPYWDGIGLEQAADEVLNQYQQVVKAFPRKKVLIAEVGWPSQGNRLKYAQPSIANEAKFIRRFLNLAEQHKLDYFIMEAFDQPWKQGPEGTVGAYWGLFNAEREPKFAMTGAVINNPSWWMEAIIATLLAFLPGAWFLSRWQSLRTNGQLFLAFLFQIAATALTWTAFAPSTQYLSLFGNAVWGILLPAQLALFTVVLINGFEMSEMLWGRLRRPFKPLLAEAGRHLPKVSLHLAICNEPPALVKQTLDSLAALDYPDFEVLVIDNNTRDPEVWMPVKEHCETLGSRFHFFTLGQWPGFKAGALNFALRETAPDAEIVGVIDSDYLVRPDWLKSMVPYFDNPKTGFVQAPQDHRDWEGNRFQEMINFEYTGFFHIGMVHRNDYDAIIQHGTMTLIRKTALQAVGNWGEWCICEDAELGLRLLKEDWESVYVNEPFGKGLTPHSFSGYKRQRFRWAYGAVQILRRHWSALMPWHRSGLGGGQKYHFLAGWLPWFGDAVHVVFSFAALAWSVLLLFWPRWFEFPLPAFMAPAFGVFAFKMMHTFSLYSARVPSTRRQRLGAAIAGMSLTYAISQAILKGLFTKSQPFLRTPKAEDKPALMQAFAMARDEILLAVAMWTVGIALLTRFGFNHPEALLWVSVLAIQSVPYLAAGYVALVNAMPARKPAAVPAPRPAAAHAAPLDTALPPHAA